MEANHRLAALFRRANLGIARELPLRALWRRAIRKHRFHRVMRRTTPIKLDRTNRRDLSIGKVRIFGFEINDQLKHGDRKRAVMVLALLFRGTEEANDPVCIKGVSSSTQTPLCQARFLCPFCWSNVGVSFFRENPHYSETSSKRV
jgi:hypothetical protein